MSYSCGTCGSTTLVLVGVRAAPDEAWVATVDDSGHWDIRCGNGHPYIPIPGTEVVIENAIDG